MSIIGSNLGPLLGRDAEIELLAALLDGVQGGGGALVLYGEPGIGKSRLLAVAAAFARERGFTVLSATGVQSEAHLAFAGLHQLLRPVRFRAADLYRIFPKLGITSRGELRSALSARTVLREP